MEHYHESSKRPYRPQESKKRRESDNNEGDQEGDGGKKHAEKEHKKEGGRSRWIDKCKEMNSTIKKEKEVRFVEELGAKTNSKQV